MKTIGLVIACAATACSQSNVYEVGTLNVKANTMYKGVPNAIYVEWGATNGCDAWQAGCDPLPGAIISVDSVTCDGCAIAGDPTGTGSGLDDAIAVTPLRAGDISFTVTATFLSTGDVETITVPVHVDQEAALGADCEVIATAQLPLYLGAGASDVARRPCGRTRLSTESILISPDVHTIDGDTIYPFSDDLKPGDSIWPVHPVSTIAVSPAPDQWADALAIYSRPDDVPALQMTATLSNAVTSTIVVPLPVICDNAAGCATAEPNERTR